MSHDYFGKAGGERASECGGATDTRSDARLPQDFVAKLHPHGAITSTNSSGARLNDDSAQLQKRAQGNAFDSPRTDEPWG